MTKIIAIWHIEHNIHGNFIASGKYDADGNAIIRGVPTILVPGTMHDVPDDLAAEMIALGAAREPEPFELELSALAAERAHHV